MGSKTVLKRHRRTKAALAAGAAASTVAATAAYRRRNARQHEGSNSPPNPAEHGFTPDRSTRFDAGREAGLGDTQPL